MLDMQNVKDIEITEGNVRTIHDKDSRLIWGRLAYDTKYAGDTYQQTYSGKNLLPYPYADGDSKTTRGITYTINDDGTVTLNGQNDGTASSAFYFVDRWGSTPLFELSAGTYYFIPNSDGINYQAYDGTNYYDFNANNNYTVTFQSNVSIRQIYVFVGKTNQTQFNNYKIYPMLTTVAGPTVADYEPYTGGIPAPNPDYPQPIQVVTGEQTVTISDGVSSQSYTIDLGSTELCKIGNYQDYIYKSGDDWYVHKEIGKVVLDGTETWTEVGSPVRYCLTTLADAFVVTDSNVLSPILSNYYISETPSDVYNKVVDYGVSLNSSTGGIRIRNNDFTSRSQYVSWLSSNNTTVYYALATPTDTQIMDATLVGQLNAVHEWLTRYGYSSTVTGNLPIIINQTNL